jgi:diguanylate cyclase (GGDEF)-like protein
LRLSRLKTIRTGIALRLGVGFAVVGLLAATANIVAQRGAALVRDAWVLTQPRASKPVVAQVAAPVLAPVSVATSSPRPQRKRQTIASRDSLMAPVGAFHWASLAHVAGNIGAADELDFARRNLHDAADSFAANAKGRAPPKLLDDLLGDIQSLEHAGLHAVQLADSRRLQQAPYLMLLDSIKQRIDIDDSRAKVYGRIFTRQHLLELRTEVNRMHSAGGVLASTDYTPEQIGVIAGAEVALAGLIAKHSVRLTRAEGKEWVTTLQLDITSATATRDAIVTLDREREAGLASLSQAAQILNQRFSQWDIARAKSAAAAVLAKPRVKALPTPALVASVPVPAPEPEVQAETDPEPELAAARQVQVAAAEAQTRDLRELIAMFTVALLGISLLICIGTVHSIVRPVRRLLSAISRVAAGEHDVMVERGGLKELDSLAAAFNDMASEVASARQESDHDKKELERRVDLRTRQLRHQADHDPLTGLPNRRQLLNLLTKQIATAASNGSRFAVYFLDLDNFKHINDGTGHESGDHLLVACAVRLRLLIGKNGFAARFGGDEFTVVLTNVPEGRSIRLFGESMLQAFTRPLVVDGRDLLVGVSVGAAVFPDHHDDAESLLRAADTALYRSKAQGKNRFSLYSPELLAAAAVRFSTEQQLRRAVDGGELALVYQPEVHSQGLEVVQVEALLRWRRPDGTIAAPELFLPVAEESGLIMEISNWALRAAVAAVARWRACDWPAARVAINISSRQLFDQRFDTRVAELLNEFRVPPEAIEIELTETVLQTGPTTIATLKRLRDLGISIALDDFGTGYSSLSSLAELPITRVKLDRSLIAQFDTSVRAQAIVNATLQLCKDFGLEVTAEGIERPQQFLSLMRQQPMLLQGYLISRPVVESKVAELVLRMPQITEGLLLESGGASTPASVVSLFPSSRERSK